MKIPTMSVRYFCNEIGLQQVISLLDAGKAGDPQAEQWFVSYNFNDSICGEPAQKDGSSARASRLGTPPRSWGSPCPWRHIELHSWRFGYSNVEYCLVKKKWWQAFFLPRFLWTASAAALRALTVWKQASWWANHFQKIANCGCTENLPQHHPSPFLLGWGVPPNGGFFGQRTGPPPNNSQKRFRFRNSSHFAFSPGDSSCAPTWSPLKCWRSLVQPLTRSDSHPKKVTLQIPGRC